MKNAYLLDRLVLVRKGVFSMREAEEMLQCSRSELHSVLFRLVKQGKLMRIKRGVFCVALGGTQGLKKGYPQNWFLIGKALAGDRPYFISHYAAMHLHGMTGESILTLFISLPEQRRVPPGLRIPVRFITISEKRFWGLEEKWVTHEEKIWVSDLERTLLDALDRPDLAGGVTEIARGLWMVKEKINTVKLTDYAKRFGSYAAAKRLGFLLEELGIGAAKNVQVIHQWIRTSSSYAFLDPTVKKEGRYLDRWRLRLNIEAENIRKNLVT